MGALFLAFEKAQDIAMLNVVNQTVFALYIVEFAAALPDEGDVFFKNLIYEVAYFTWLFQPLFQVAFVDGLSHPGGVEALHHFVKEVAKNPRVEVLADAFGLANAGHIAVVET